MKLATLPTTVPTVSDHVDDATYDDSFFGGEETAVETTDKEQQITSEQPVTSEADEEERRWWAKVEVLGKIKDCARMIELVESEVDDYQESIKESKEVLKGQQALLARYSSQLADIIEGKPLPKNPNEPEDVSAPESTAVNDWRDYPTVSLLKGMKGLGDKKLEAIVEEAPTVGKLEELRGNASMAHKQFKDVLPKGFGEELCDRIEQRIEHYVREWMLTTGL